MDEEKLLPTILEIPAKESPYDPTKDTMLVAAASKLFGMEAGIEKLKQEDWLSINDMLNQINRK